MMVHNCIPSYCEDWDQKIAWPHKFESSQGNITRPRLKQTNKIQTFQIMEKMRLLTLM
jgi:hypothetical protein